MRKLFIVFSLAILVGACAPVSRPVYTYSASGGWNKSGERHEQRESHYRPGIPESIFKMGRSILVGEWVESSSQVTATPNSYTVKESSTVAPYRGGIMLPGSYGYRMRGFRY